MGPEPDARTKQIKLDFRSGGWVLLLAAAFALLVLGWRLAMVARHGEDPYAAPMTSIEQYGFDLSNLRVERQQLVPAAPRDFLKALDDPAVVPASEIPAINEEHRKYLLASDRVIGVTIGGQARAYPLRVLNWHEVINDTLAGAPIAVTYSPICDSAVVFERRVGQAEARFGVSGLLYNSNLVMYDRQPAGGESLWSQLRFGVIAGPAAERHETLRIVPSQVVYWQDWQQEHPQTTVVAPSRENIRKYRRDPYGSYYGSDRLRYPVAPLPPTRGQWEYKTDVVAVEAGGRWCAFPLPLIAQQAGLRGRWEATWQGQTLTFDYRLLPHSGATVWVRGTEDEPVRAVRSFWFAWYAMHPETTVYGSEPTAPVTAHK